MNSVIVHLTLQNLKQFVQVTQSFESDIDLKKDNYIVDAKSVLGITSLDFSNSVEVKIITSNEDELVRFIEEMKQFQ